jgi:ABC-2 type transport system ATP-binding protein
MDPAVTVTDLVVDRGRRRVLDALSFTVAITVLGLPAGSPALRARVGYVTQAPSVYGDLSVRDNARYFAALYGRTAHEADAAIAAVGLSDHTGQLVDDLSGGQKGRASLACALVGDPDLLVLDEPTVGLDPVLRVELWDRFHALAEGGTTLIVSSHVMDEAARCDRLLLLRDGDLLADSTPAQLRADGGSDDLEQAFLQLIRNRTQEVAA